MKDRAWIDRMKGRKRDAWWSFMMDQVWCLWRRVV